jgi:molecular chaperone IbpA
MRAFDFAPLYRSTVGFDRMFSMLDAVGRDEIPREQERVWDFDWYTILPPPIEELVEK